MNPELVLPPDFDEYAWEVEAKGYCPASASVGERSVEVTFYDPTRLAQTIADDLTAGRSFAEHRLFVVPRVTRDAMREALRAAPIQLFD